MNPTAENDSGSAADALIAISHEGTRRRSSLRRAAALILVAAVILGAAMFWLGSIAGRDGAAKDALAAARQAAMDAIRPATTRVAILLPCQEEPSNGECAELNDAAKPQLTGFGLARSARGTIGKVTVEHFYHFPLPSFGSGAEAFGEISDELEKMYVAGIRYFIVTMSDTVLKLTAPDGIWHEFSNRHPIDPPVMIATVASAPLDPGNDIHSGVIRNYIRSDDEVNQFAAYVHSQNPEERAMEVIVLYIDDKYGQKASELVKSKISFETPIPFASIAVRGSEFAPAIEELDTRIHEENHTFVILIGYGEMVKEMLKLLNDEERAHTQNNGTTRIDDVLVASTLTEKSWQPDFYSDPRQQSLPRISTLLPFGTAPRDCEGGAVCQFSFMTLRVVLDCAEEIDRQYLDNLEDANVGDFYSVEKFFDCFEKQSGSSEFPFPDIELSSTGDSIVPLWVKVTRGAAGRE